MPPRHYWKGYLKLSLVTCPVALVPATTDREKIRFRTLNRKTGNPVVSRYVDAESGKIVKDTDQARGYPVEEDGHVILEDEELEQVALESTRTIDIQAFVPDDSIGWIWRDRPHYLIPDDKVGEEAFAVIRDAMKATRTNGVSRLVIYRRERAVLLEPWGKGIVAWTLRYGDEVRDDADYFGDIDREKPDAKTLRLIEKLIAEKKKDWSPDMADDPVQDTLRRIIDRKKKGRKPAAPRKKPEATEKAGDNVVSIMDALKRSVAAEGGKK
ncbi:MAG: Ku protein [Flavobacteriaceae bacterium]